MIPELFTVPDIVKMVDEPLVSVKKEIRTLVLAVYCELRYSSEPLLTLASPAWHLTSLASHPELVRDHVPERIAYMASLWV